MTINSDIYLNMLDSQSQPNTDCDNLKIPAIKLWTSIRKGDLNQVKYLVLNSSQMNQVSDSSSYQNFVYQSGMTSIRERTNSSNTISCSTASFDRTQVASPLQVLSDEDIASNHINNNDQKQSYHQQSDIEQQIGFSNTKVFFDNNNSNIINDDTQIICKSVTYTQQQQQANLRTHCNSALNLQSTNFNSLEASLLLEMPLNKYGWNSLHAACYYGHLSIVQFLIENCEINVNKVNVNGWHSLFFAVFGGHLDVIDYLLYETDIDFDLHDKQERTALSIAENIEDQEVIEILKERLENDNHMSFNSGNWSSKFNQSYESLLKTLEDY